MLVISTSLKVVSIAVVFFDSTNFLLIVLRNALIFSCRTFLLYNSAPATNAFLPGCVKASSTSCFIILPPTPEGVMDFVSIFLSAIIADATGLAFTSLATAVTGASFTTAFFSSIFGAATLVPSGFIAVSSIVANMSPIFKVSPSWPFVERIPAFSAFTSKVAFSLSNSRSC